MVWTTTVMSRLSEEKKAVTTFAASLICTTFTIRLKFWWTNSSVLPPVSLRMMISTYIRQLISERRLFLVCTTKNLVRYPLKRQNQAKTFARIRKSVKVGETVVQMPSYQLNQRLLASVVRDEAPLLTIFSHELSGVTP